MFEEVPRTRRGLAAYLGVSHLTARRIVLGPFVIGGGFVLAAVGGSVAVAATVFTASTIRASDVPPHPHQPLVVAVSSTAGRPPAASGTGHTSPTRTNPASTGSATGSAAPPASTTSSVPSRSASAGLTGAVSTRPPASGTASATKPSSVAPTSQPSPAGNAVVYVNGWDSSNKQLLFEFASVSKGTGPQHSDVYTIASTQQYTASLAADLRVVSGGRLCPPAGSICTVDQLIDGTQQGFFAELAIDPSAAVHQVVEHDNVMQYAPTQPIPSPTQTPTQSNPAATAQPTA